MVTGSRELIREMNRRLVLETVINDGPLSRAAISKKLGLTKATISAIVQDLLDEQYIEEIGSDQTQYGRKPIPVTVLSTEWLYYHPRSRRGMHRADGL